MILLVMLGIFHCWFCSNETKKLKELSLITKNKNKFPRRSSEITRQSSRMYMENEDENKQKRIDWIETSKCKKKNKINSI